MISLRIGVCHPNTRSHVRLLGPCFKTGRTTPVAATILAHSAPGGAGSGEASTRGPLGSCRARGRWRACWRGPRRSCYRGPRTKRGPEHQSGTLASNDFTYYFTFFSKFFSSFPHGTCSLSVSRPYLVLEEIYLPLRAALPSNPTLRYNMTTADNPPVRTGLSPSQGSHSKEFQPGARRTIYP